MKFTKMQGAGNDFIVINNLKEQLSEEVFSDLARRLCQRRMAVGADGFMVADAPRCGGDFRMLFYNADGSLGEMCGNGARCIARFGYEEGLAGETMNIETTAGMVKGWRLDDMRYRVRLNDVSVMELDRSLSVAAAGFPGQWNCAYVELGNPGIPHLIVEYPGLKEADTEELWTLGDGLRHHPSLPKGANINFYEILQDGSIFERTFERGVEDFTYACGTGTGSLAAVLVKQGKVPGDRAVAVDMQGGRLEIEVVCQGDLITDLYLTGPAVIVCHGEVEV